MEMSDMRPALQDTGQSFVIHNPTSRSLFQAKPCPRFPEFHSF